MLAPRCTLILLLACPTSLIHTAPTLPTSTQLNNGFTALTGFDANTVVLMFNQPPQYIPLGSSGPISFDIKTGDSHASAQQSAVQTTQQIAEQTAAQSIIPAAWIEMIGNLNPRQKLTTMKVWMLQHLALLGAASVTVGYGYMWREIYVLKKVIHHPHSWAHWHAQLTLEQLLAVSQAELAEQLQQSIQQHYINDANPTDFVQPLVRFITDLNQITHDTARFIALYTWIRRLRLTGIFPGGEATFLQAQQNLQRLAYIKSIFAVWAKQYKVDQHRLLEHA